MLPALLESEKNNLKTTYFTVYLLSRVENLKNDRIIHSTLLEGPEQKSLS